AGEGDRLLPRGGGARPGVLPAPRGPRRRLSRPGILRARPAEGGLASRRRGGPPGPGARRRRGRRPRLPGLRVAVRGLAVVARPPGAGARRGLEPEPGRLAAMVRAL